MNHSSLSDNVMKFTCFQSIFNALYPSSNEYLDECKVSEQGSIYC